MTYLENLCKACLLCDWNGLKVNRKLYEESEVFKKYKTLSNQLKRENFYNFDITRSEDEKLVFEIEVSDGSPSHLRHDLQRLKKILTSHRLKTNLIFNSGKIKIELE